MSLNSIERLDLLKLKTSHWQMIRAPVGTLEPRYQPAVVAINSHEIAILGGWSREGYSRLGDVVLFDTRTRACAKVVSQDQSSQDFFTFNALANQSGRTKFETVVVLGSDANHKPCLLEFRKGDSRVKIIDAILA